MDPARRAHFLGGTIEHAPTSSTSVRLGCSVWSGSAISMDGHGAAVHQKGAVSGAMSIPCIKLGRGGDDTHPPAAPETEWIHSPGRDGRNRSVQRIDGSCEAWRISIWSYSRVATPIRSAEAAHLVVVVVRVVTSAKHSRVRRMGSTGRSFKIILQGGVTISRWSGMSDAGDCDALVNACTGCIPLAKAQKK